MTSKHIFLGREEHIKRLNKDIFDYPHSDEGDCISICGPHGIGKTYLINHLCEKFLQKSLRTRFPKEYCFYFEINNTENQNLIDLKNNLLVLLSKKITVEVLEQALSEFQEGSFEKWIAEEAVKDLKEAYSLPEAQPNKNAKGYDNWFGKINRSLEPYGNTSVFFNYTQLGIRLILIIDEFDRATKGFPTGDIFAWLFSLSNKSSSGMNLNMSVVLISRKAPNLIAHHMEDGSNFEDAYPPYHIAGFNNDDLGLYFESFNSLSSGVPSEEVRQKILYLCGRHPGLLMRMRSELECIDYEVSLSTINRIWHTNRGMFHSVYEKLCKRLQKETLSDNSKITLMDAMLYQFEFFVTKDNAFDYILIESGYATSMNYEKAVYSESLGGFYYPDIFVLSGEKEIENARVPLSCEPISPYFLEYLKTVWKPDKAKGIADYLGITERMLRLFLQDRLQYKYSSEWEDYARTALGKRKTNYFIRLQEVAEESGYTGTISILDIMGFDNYYDLIVQEWNKGFSDYFSGYGKHGLSDLDSIKEDLYFLCTCRNTARHENIKVLNQNQLKRLESTCSKLNELFANYLADNELMS